MEQYKEQFEAMIMKIIGFIDMILEKYLGEIFK